MGGEGWRPCESIQINIVGIELDMQLRALRRGGRHAHHVRCDLAVVRDEHGVRDVNVLWDASLVEQLAPPYILCVDGPCIVGQRVLSRARLARAAPTSPIASTARASATRVRTECAFLRFVLFDDRGHRRVAQPHEVKYPLDAHHRVARMHVVAEEPCNATVVCRRVVRARLARREDGQCTAQSCGCSCRRRRTPCRRSPR